MEIQGLYHHHNIIEFVHKIISYPCLVRRHDDDDALVVPVQCYTKWKINYCGNNKHRLWWGRIGGDRQMWLVVTIRLPCQIDNRQTNMEIKL